MYKKLKCVTLKMLVVFMLMSGVFTTAIGDVFAEENSDDQVSLEMQVEENTESNSIDVKIALHNIGSEKIENVKITGSIPEDMKIIDSNSNILEIDSIAPDMREELEYSIKLSTSGNESVDNDNTTQVKPIENTNSDIGSKSETLSNNKNVNTGDDESLGIWIVLGVITFIIVLAIFKNKKLKTTLTLFICISMAIPLVNGIMPVKAIENSRKKLEVSEKITIDGNDYTINATAEYNELDAIPISSDVVTRGEWIQSLVDTMGFSDSLVEYDQDEYPYTDILEHENFNAIMFAYANGYLPNNDETEFNPNGIATREFAALTSVLALGFVPVKDIVCDDVNDITYKQEVETAVAMDIFRLDENKFYPNRSLTKSEANAAIEGIENILDSENVDESFESDIDYKEGIIELSDDCQYEIDGNKITIDSQQIAGTIAEGTIIVLPDQTAYKVVSFTENDGKYIIETEEPEIDETVDSIDVQGYGELDMNQFIPAEGVTILNTNSRASRANIVDTEGFLGGPGQVEFTLKKEVGDYELYGKLKVSLNKVLYKADIDLGWSGFDVNNVYIKIPKTVEIDGGFKLEGAEGDLAPKDGLFELGKVPVTGVPGATVYVQIGIYYNFEGRVHVVYKLDGTSGIQILNNRLRMINDLNSDLEVPELEATAKIGPRVAGLLEICNRWDLIDFSASVGAGFTGTASLQTLDLFCLDASVYLYGELQALQEGVIGDWLDIGYTWEFWNKDNSPLKANWHFENFIPVDECTAAKGTIKGMVAKADDRSVPIKNATVSVYDKGNYNEITSTKTDEEGNYSIMLREGDYVVIISAEGYISYECDISVVRDEEQYIQTFLLIDEQNLGIYGVADGIIRNAVTGEPLSDVNVSLRKGWNKLEGDIVLNTTTDFNGRYQVDLPVGYYTVYLQKSGFESKSFNIVVLPVSVVQQNSTLVPTGDDVANGDLRIVLTWGSTPSDLDSHLVGPTADGSDYFHIYYGNKNYTDSSTKYADLDLDDTTSYGPETTTVYNKTENGIYSFYVHDYSNRSDSESTAMSSSGAVVEVYLDGRFYTAYPVPSGEKGTYWHVFDYDPINNKIIPVNEFKEEIIYNQSSRTRSSTEVQYDMNKE